MEYREEAYKNYTSLHYPHLLIFNEENYVTAAKVFDARFRKIIPADASARVLEIGCGTGQFLYFLKSKGFNNVQGIDVSPEQVDVAKNVCSDVLCVDALSWLESSNATYDFIVCIDVLEHLKKEEVLPLLHAMRRRLSPGGIVLVQTPNAESPWGMKVRYGDMTHELAYEPNVLRQLFLEVGFTSVNSYECAPLPMTIKSSIRVCLWRFIWLSLAAWNYIETGSKGSGIYTRVFYAVVR